MNSITLSILYLLISRRTELPIYGLSLPGHFILKYSDEKEEFFIDPFNKGIIISIKEAQKFIKNIGMTDDEFKEIPYLKNSTDREIILRVMRKLSEIYKKTGDLLKTEQIEKDNVQFLLVQLC
ncbi:MAG: transglutaminase family protein [Ignavibacteria bacterium]